MLLKLLGCKLYYLFWVVQEENDGSMYGILSFQKVTVIYRKRGCDYEFM